MAVHFPRKAIQLQAIRLSLEDVGRIYERLELQLHEQAEIEISKSVKPPDKTDAEFEAIKKDVRERAFKITVTVAGSDGHSLFGDDATIFKSPNLPDQISQIYMTNMTAYEAVVGRCRGS